MLTDCGNEYGYQAYVITLMNPRIKAWKAPDSSNKKQINHNVKRRRCITAINFPHAKAQARNHH